MNARDKGRRLAGDGPDVPELELAIHALSAILEIIAFLNDEQHSLSEERDRNISPGLLLAGRLLTENLKRLF